MKGIVVPFFLGLSFPLPPTPRIDEGRGKGRPRKKKRKNNGARSEERAPESEDVVF